MSLTETKSRSCPRAMLHGSLTETKSRSCPRAMLHGGLRGAGILVSMAIVAWGCGSSTSDAPPTSAGDAAPTTCAELPASGVDVATALSKYPRLSDYCLFDVVKSNGRAKLVPKSGVLPYDLNTPLFSDYTRKARFVWLPKGTSATYTAEGAFTFPIGTILIKTFGFAADLRKPDEDVTLIETRLLVQTAQGWTALPYVWADDQSDASLQLGGSVRPTTFLAADGASVSANYLLPSSTQCGTCHTNDASVLELLGPKAKNLNRDFAYDTGSENQLAHWTKVGALSGAPAPSAAPKMARWDDPSTGSVEDRSRAWLEMNCAHCHDEHRTARTTGLYLPTTQTDPAKLGVCKPPVAAGPGSGGLKLDVVPGKPDESILVFRIGSTTPGLMMPALGRSVVHKEGVELVRAWIAGMSGACK